MIFESGLSSNFVLGKRVPIPRPPAQAQSRQDINRNVLQTYSMEGGHKTQGGASSSRVYQSKHGNLSITRVERTYTSFSQAFSKKLHITPPVQVFRNFTPIQCSQFDYGIPEQQPIELKSEQESEFEQELNSEQEYESEQESESEPKLDSVQELDSEEEFNSDKESDSDKEGKFENEEQFDHLYDQKKLAKAKKYEKWLHQKRNVNPKAFGSGFESRRRCENLETFTARIELKPGAFSPREVSSSEQNKSNKTWSKSKGVNGKDYSEVEFGNDSSRLRFVVGKHPEGLQNYLTHGNSDGSFQKDKLICSLADFALTVSLHVFNSFLPAGDHSWSFHHNLHFSPFDTINSRQLKILAKKDNTINASFPEWEAGGKASDQINPCIKRRRQA